MPQSDYGDWKEFWENQAKVTDLHEAVRGQKILGDEVQSFHDQKLRTLLELEPSNVVLDAGCGVGDQAILISPEASKIKAIDFSPAMVDRCKERLADQGITNTEVEVANVTSLPFSDASFDRTVSIAVLQYLNPDEVNKMFSEIKRVVKPGGVVVYHIKNLFSPTGLMITTGRFIRALIKGRPPLEYRYRTHRWYRKRLKSFGKIEESYAYGTWTPFMPKKLMAFIARMEIRWFNLFGFIPLGKEYYIKVRSL